MEDLPLKDTGPRLYTLVRTDIYQLNPGKLAAQASHATSSFIFDVLYYKGPEGDFLKSQMEAWRRQGKNDGFGTEITLAATRKEIYEALEFLSMNLNNLTGVVVDPTYPFYNHNGEFFTAEEMTCAYVFATVNTTNWDMEVLKKFPLHP